MTKSKMLLLDFLLLVAGAAEALLPSSLDLLSNVPQSSGEDASLDDISLNMAASSAWLDNTSPATTASSLFMPNSSLASNKVSAEIKFICQDRYGSDLNPQSCQSAALTIEHQLTRPFTWGPRGTAATFDFPMPQRWVSCTWILRPFGHWVAC